jgi:transposase-like protein
MKFTITDFRKLFPNDSACLDKIFKLRFGNLEVCPECENKANFRRITTRRSYQCKHCYYQIYPTAGTVFEKTTTPLSYWFYAIYLMTATRNGVSAKELERQLGVTYKCAFRMAHKIRELMSKKNFNQLNGFVEIDETYVGGKFSGKRGRGSENKEIVFGMLERCGDVKAIHVQNTKRKTLYPIIEENISKDSKLNSDEYPVYHKLNELGYDHRIINHSQEQYRFNDISTNSIEGFFSQLKRTINGTHIHVSKDYLQNYVDECAFRYNHRKSEKPMFDIAIQNVTNEKVFETIPQQKKETT